MSCWSSLRSSSRNTVNWWTSPLNCLLQLIANFWRLRAQVQTVPTTWETRALSSAACCGGWRSRTSNCRLQGGSDATGIETTATPGSSSERSVISSFGRLAGGGWQSSLSDMGRRTGNKIIETLVALVLSILLKFIDHLFVIHKLNIILVVEKNFSHGQPFNHAFQYWPWTN